MQVESGVPRVPVDVREETGVAGLPEIVRVGVIVGVPDFGLKKGKYKKVVSYSNTVVGAGEAVAEAELDPDGVSGDVSPSIFPLPANVAINPVPMYTTRTR